MQASGNGMWRQVLLALSVLGTAFITMDERARFLAFVLFAVTDTGWMVDAYFRKDKEQFLMYLIYDLFNVVGLVNNAGALL
jgi:hypothetical protein